MLKKTLFCGYDRSYAVLPRVQCKEYNLQFMLLSIYFPHAIKSVWCTVIFSSHNMLVFRRLAISDYMVTTAPYDEIRNESDHGGDPTGLFSNITVHNLLVWIHHNSTLHTFFQMNTIPRLELTLHTEGKGSSLGIDCTCCSSREAFKKWLMTKALLCLIGNGLKIKKPAQFVLKSILASPMWPQAE